MLKYIGILFSASTTLRSTVKYLSSQDKDAHNINPKKNTDIKNSNMDRKFTSFYANLEDLD